jgi:ornithine decarboxylase
MLGAYGCAMRTGFNGFTSETQVEVTDAPMASLYDESIAAPRRANVVKIGK